MSYLNPLINLQSCIAALSPHSTFDSCYVDAPTCLTLPFHEILSQSVSTEHPLFSSFRPPNLVLQRYPSAKKLLVSDVFYFDSESQVLRVRLSFRQSRLPNIAKSVVRLVQYHHLHFKPYFWHQCSFTPRPTLADNALPSLRPFCLWLLLPLPQSDHQSPEMPARCRGRLLLNSIRYFKKVLFLSSPAVSISSIHSPQWRSFWSLSIPPPSRTVWYRAIYHKIPSRSLLHSHIPQDHPSPDCDICTTSSPETFQHFLFSCPPKLLVWREMYQTYIHQSIISDEALLHSLQQLLRYSPLSHDRDTTLPLNELSIPQLFAATLVTI